MKNVKHVLKEHNIGALLVSSYYDILYLTGFKTLSSTEREAYVLATGKNIYVFSDGRYRPQTKSGLFTFVLLTPEKGLIAYLREIISRERIASLGFQQEDLKWTEHNVLEKSLNIPLVPVDRALLFLRRVKDKEEIESIGKACLAADECLGDIAPLIRPGLSEKEIAWKMESWIRSKGYSLAFDPMVASGANAAMPHYDTKEGNGKVEKGSPVLIDFGVAYKGYASDITRMFFPGKPGTEIARAYEKLLTAQQESVSSSRAGMRGGELDELCRSKTGSFYPHSTGHGIGLEVHEYPKISSTSNEILEKGNVFTVEPGIYVPGSWGMRIEDTLVLGNDGKAQTLTRFPKKMMIV